MYIICHFGIKTHTQKEERRENQLLQNTSISLFPLKKKKLRQAPFCMAWSKFPPGWRFYHRNPRPPRSDDEDPRIIALMTMRLVLHLGSGLGPLPNGWIHKQTNRINIYLAWTTPIKINEIYGSVHVPCPMDPVGVWIRFRWICWFALERKV